MDVATYHSLSGRQIYDWTLISLTRGKPPSVSTTPDLFESLSKSRDVGGDSDVWNQASLETFQSHLELETNSGRHNARRRILKSVMSEFYRNDGTEIYKSRDPDSRSAQRPLTSLFPVFTHCSSLPSPSWSLHLHHLPPPFHPVSLSCSPSSSLWNYLPPHPTSTPPSSSNCPLSWHRTLLRGDFDTGQSSPLKSH